MAVAVTIPAALTTVEPGRASTSEIRVANTGTADDAVRLEVHGEAAPWALAVPPEVSVPAGAEVVARLLFNVPRSSAARAGLWSYRLTAASTSGPASLGEAEGFVEVAPFSETTAQLVPRVAPARSAERAFRLTNEGNCEIRATLDAVIDDPRATIEVRPTVLVVPPGQTQTAAVRVEPSRRLPRARKPNRFCVTARPEGGEPVEVSGVVESVSAPEPWLLRAVAAVIVPVLFGLVSGRSPFWSRNQSSPREIVADAMPKVVREGSSRVTFAFQISDAVPESTPSGYRLEGVLDYRRNQGRFTLEPAGMGLPGLRGAVELIKGVSALYVRLPQPTVVRPAKPWLVLRAEDFAEGQWLERVDEDLATVVFAAVTGVGSIGETFQEALEESATELTRAGRETLRGAATRRYHLTLDSGVLAAAVSPEIGGTVDAGTADVWVDGRGRTRQRRMNLQISGTDPAQPPWRGTSTMEFFDFGVSVHVEEPSPDQVVSVAQLPVRVPS